MHALVNAARADLVNWNPEIAVVSFCGSQGPLSLYRTNGDLIWSSLLRGSGPVLSTTWSTNGQLIAVIYEEGAYQIFLETSGRAIHASPPDAHASCVAWSRPSDPEVLTDGEAGLFSDIVDALPRVFTHRTAGSDMLVGTEDGKLEIILYGVFTIGNVEVGTGRIERIIVGNDTNDFSVVVDGTLVTLNAAYMASVGVSRMRELALKPARLVALLSELDGAIQKYDDELAKLWNPMKLFFPDSKLAAPAVCMYELILTRMVTPEVREWLEEQHEGGFKRWYKNMTQNYENLRKLTLETLIPATQEVVILFGDLIGLASSEDVNNPGKDGNSFLAEEPERASELSGELLQTLFKFVGIIGNELALFKCFACLIQDVLGQVLDKTLSVVDSAVGDDTAAAKFVQKNFGHTELDPISHLIRQVNQEFQTSIKHTRDSLRDQITIERRINIPHKVLAATYAQDAYFLICEGENPGALTLGVAGESLRTIVELKGHQAVFSDSGHIVVSDETTRRLLLYEVSASGVAMVREIQLERPAYGFDCKNNHLCILLDDKHVNFADL